MSEISQNRLLTILGIVTAAVTIGIQIMSVGEIKGRLETVIGNHERRLDSQDGKLDEHTRDISEIKGKLHGITQTKPPTPNSQQLAD